MSSEHAIEKVPLSDIREGDMLQHPKSGKWIKVTHTADRTTNIGETGSEREQAVAEHYRVYSGDGGEEIDSRSVAGPVNRQVRE